MFGGPVGVEDVGGDARGAVDRRTATMLYGVGTAVFPYAGSCLRIGASVTAPRGGPLGRTTARVGPAAAVLRRVTVGSLTAGAARAVSEAVS